MRDNPILTTRKSDCHRHRFQTSKTSKSKFRRPIVRTTGEIPVYLSIVHCWVTDCDTMLDDCMMAAMLLSPTLSSVFSVKTFVFIHGLFSPTTGLLKFSDAIVVLSGALSCCSGIATGFRLVFANVSVSLLWSSVWLVLP